MRIVTHLLGLHKHALDVKVPLEPCNVSDRHAVIGAHILDFVDVCVKVDEHTCTFDVTKLGALDQRRVEDPLASLVVDFGAVLEKNFRALAEVVSACNEEGGVSVAIAFVDVLLVNLPGGCGDDIDAGGVTAGRAHHEGIPAERVHRGRDVHFIPFTQYAANERLHGMLLKQRRHTRQVSMLASMKEILGGRR